jgi:hypothetical protein
MTTSTWLPPLLVAALGIAGTLAAAVFTQRNASRRDDITWAREREREQERWAREDAARTFTDRRDAYIQFSDALRGMTGLIYNFGTGRIVQPDDANDGELPADFGLATFRKLQHLRLYATPQAGRRADVAFMVAWRWGNRARYAQDDEQFYEDQNSFDEADELLRDAIRTDLGVPGGSTAWQWGVMDPTTGEVLDEQFLE